LVSEFEQHPNPQNAPNVKILPGLDETAMHDCVGVPSDAPGFAAPDLVGMVSGQR
jgi:hypothetical protein